MIRQCWTAVLAAGILAGAGQAYEVRPECRPLTGPRAVSSLHINDMVRISATFTEEHLIYHQVNLFPPIEHYDDASFILTGRSHGAEPRLFFRWHKTPDGWPNATSPIVYEVLEDHFEHVDERLDVNLYVGREFMWIESIADGRPHHVTTSPIFFGVENPVLSATFEQFATAVATHFSARIATPGEAVTAVARCSFANNERFEDVIDREYARDASEQATWTRAYRDYRRRLDVATRWLASGH
jgi:hypothetical protein